MGSTKRNAMPKQALAKRGLAGLVNKAEKRNGDTAFHLAAQLDAIKAYFFLKGLHRFQISNKQLKVLWMED